MKTKQDLKKVFENGDKPKQEDFWDLIESYFHRDEPVTLEELSLLKSNLATVDKTNNGTETLGNVDTKEQVNAKINSAIDALKANAPETYDTLKEIADYIANDSNAEAALLQLINTKLDKPTMTNNYYGLWDDTNKIFVDGHLKEVKVRSEDTVAIRGSSGNLGHDYFHVGRYTDGNSTFPDKCYFGIGYDGNQYNVVCAASDNVPNRHGTIAMSIVDTEYGQPSIYNHVQYTDKSGTYNNTDGSTHLTVSGMDDSVQPTSDYSINVDNILFHRYLVNDKYLEYIRDNGYWQFYKPIKGANIKDGLRFTLPTTITPTPNTLIPKTDGSGLLWYNNNSVGGELFTGTPFVYNVPSTITVNHVNAPATPDVPSYVQAIQDRLTQLNQPGVAMLKFQNWNVVTANNVANSNIGVINNNLIKTSISAFNSETGISAQSSIISISTNKVLPADKDWVVMFTTNLGHDGESYSNGGIKWVMKRNIGLFSGDTSGFVPPEVYIFDAGGEWNWNNIMKLQSGKRCTGASGTSDGNNIFTGSESANVKVTMLKAGNHILVQIYYAGYAISDIYSSTILSGDAGFSVLCKKPSSGGNGYVGEVSDVRYYVFP